LCTKTCPESWGDLSRAEVPWDTLARRDPKADIARRWAAANCGLRRCELGGDEHKLRIVLLIAAAASFATAAFAQSPNIVVEEIMVPSADPGIEIYVRNKRPAELTAFRPERTVLFVHGATYPAHTSFDLKLDGLS
jgi:hypothetical protein